jgi:hypothetical protein
MHPALWHLPPATDSDRERSHPSHEEDDLQPRHHAAKNGSPTGPRDSSTRRSAPGDRAESGATERFPHGSQLVDKGEHTDHAVPHAIAPHGPSKPSADPTVPLHLCSLQNLKPLGHLSSGPNRSSHTAFPNSHALAPLSTLLPLALAAPIDLPHTALVSPNQPTSCRKGSHSPGIRAAFPLSGARSAIVPMSFRFCCNRPGPLTAGIPLPLGLTHSPN